LLILKDTIKDERVFLSGRQPASHTEEKYGG